MVENNPAQFFAEYSEADNPPYEGYPAWLLKEAGNDPALIDLIERREIIGDDIVTAGGYGALEDDQREWISKERNSLNKQIQGKKAELNLPED